MHWDPKKLAFNIIDYNLKLKLMFQYVVVSKRAFLVVYNIYTYYNSLGQELEACHGPDHVT